VGVLVAVALGGTGVLVGVSVGVAVAGTGVLVGVVLGGTGVLVLGARVAVPVADTVAEAVGVRVPVGTAVRLTVAVGAGVRQAGLLWPWSSRPRSGCFWSQALLPACGGLSVAPIVAGSTACSAMTARSRTNHAGDRPRRLGNGISTFLGRRHSGSVGRRGGSGSHPAASEAGV